MGHINMDKRQSQIYPTDRITGVDGTPTAATGGIVYASTTDSAFTTITQVVEQPITQPGMTTVITTTRLIPVTDPASYSEILASESAHKSISPSTSTAAAVAATSSAAAKSSSGGNLATLIPAIVAPIAAVLLISFGIFWFFMRRRHHREIKRAEFVMAGMKEKRTPSRGNSTNSSSSTRGLVRAEKFDRTPNVTTTELYRPSHELTPPTMPTTEIGLARPMTPPDKNMTNARSSYSKGQPGRPSFDAVPNFSSLRPSIDGSNLRPAVRPSLDSALLRPTVRPQFDVRPSLDSALLRPGASAGVAREPFNPSGNQPRSSSDTRRGPGRPHNNPPLGRPGPQDMRSPAQGPPSAWHGPQRGQDDYHSQPSGNGANMNSANRAPAPAPLNSSTPTGAFNGASPISQYSPIVKETPLLDAMRSEFASKPQGTTATAPQTSNSQAAAELERARSPVDENVLSIENMRIARLANSSRLGFNSPTESPPTKSSDWPSSGKPSSPELPAPLSRFDSSSRSGQNNYNIGLSNYGPPRIGNLPAAHPPPSKRIPPRPYERQSVISRISTDDGYVDMEIDGKSDVSSLDEREKWELETKLSAQGSTLHLPLSTSKPKKHSKNPSDANLRDRDSEGPFVLSRY